MGDETLSDEEKRKLLKPDPTIEQIISIAKENFTVGGDNGVEIIKELDSYDDRNYWCRISGVDLLVKVHNGVESSDACRAVEEGKQDSVIHFQYAIMKTLRESKIPASFPVHLEDARKGQDPLVRSLPVVSKEHSPCKLVVSAYTWVPGMPMSSLKVGIRIVRAPGTSLL